MTHPNQIAALVRAARARAKLTPALVRSLHARDLTDVEAARLSRVTPSGFRRARVALSLPPNVSAARAAQAASGAIGAAVRVANKLARVSALRLPPAPYTPFGLRVVIALASGPRTQPQLSRDLSCPHGHNSYLAKTLNAMRRAGVLRSESIYGGPTFRRPSRWALAPATVAATFSRTALSPLQQLVCTSPAAVRVTGVIASAYAGSCPLPPDEVRALAGAGAVFAARTYDPTRAPFFEYAQLRVRGVIREALRDRAPKGYRRSDRHLAPEITAPVDFDPLSDASPVGWELSSVDAVAAIAARLTDHRLRAVVTLYHAHGLTLKQIGARLGLSEPRVSQLYNRALAELREKLAARTFFS